MSANSPDGASEPDTSDPIASNPYASPGPDTKPREPWRLPFTLIELLVVMAIVAVLVGLLLPSVRSTPRGSISRAQCGGKLRAIALGLDAYESRYGAFPPAYTVDAAGKPLHSWRVLLLPFIEGDPLYQKIDLSKPWNDPAKAFARDNMPEVYACPMLSGQPGFTVYMANAAPGGMFTPKHGRLRSDVTDPESSTVMLVEVPRDQAVHWMAPLDATATLVDMSSPNHVLGRSQNRRGMHVAYVDTRIEFLYADTPEAKRKSMVTIAGNDDAAEP